MGVRPGRGEPGAGGRAADHHLLLLRAFRERLRAAFARRGDSLFEITDALLTGGGVASPPHLSLVPVHRRGWGSLYAALSKGRIDSESLRDLLARQPFDDGLVAERPVVHAVDVSVWPRCDAEASPGRGYHYHPSRHSAGQPIVAGWAYQFVAGLSFERDSWVAPTDARRVRPEEDANRVAAEQVRALADRLSPQSAAPLFVFDAGYDPVRLQRDPEGCRAQILVRLHSGRTFYADPPEPERARVGRPFVHGPKFCCTDPNTWPLPTAEHLCKTANYGDVRVRAWSGLHPKTRRAYERYGSESAAVVRGTVVLMEVGRLPRGERRRKPKGIGLGVVPLVYIWLGTVFLSRGDYERAVPMFEEGW